MIDPKIRKHLSKGQIKFDDVDLESQRLFDGRPMNPDHGVDALRGVVDAARKASDALQQFAASTPFDSVAIERASTALLSSPVPERRRDLWGALWVRVRRWARRMFPVLCGPIVMHGICR